MSKDEREALAHGRALVSDAAIILNAQARLIEGMAHTMRLCGGSLAAQSAVLLAAADLHDAVACLHSARAADLVFITRANGEAARLREAAESIVRHDQLILPVLKESAA